MTPLTCLLMAELYGFFRLVSIFFYIVLSVGRNCVCIYMVCKQSHCQHVGFQQQDYMQKSRARSLELVTCHQFRKQLLHDIESLEGCELLKVKLFTKKQNVFSDVEIPQSSSFNMLYFHIFLFSICLSLSFCCVRLRNSQRKDSAQCSAMNKLNTDLLLLKQIQVILVTKLYKNIPCTDVI